MILIETSLFIRVQIFGSYRVEPCISKDQLILEKFLEFVFGGEVLLFSEVIHLVEDFGKVFHVDTSERSDFLIPKGKRVLFLAS